MLGNRAGARHDALDGIHATHFRRNVEDAIANADLHGDLLCERALADARTGRDDNELTRLHAARRYVELLNPERHAHSRALWSDLHKVCCGLRDRLNVRERLTLADSG